MIKDKPVLLYVMYLFVFVKYDLFDKIKQQIFGSLRILKENIYKSLVIIIVIEFFK